MQPAGKYRDDRSSKAVAGTPGRPAFPARPAIQPRPSFNRAETRPAPPVYRPNTIQRAQQNRTLSVETRPAPPVYRPMTAAPLSAQPKHAGVSLPIERRPAPAVYRPALTPGPLMQAKRVPGLFRRETRPTPQAYRPQNTTARGPASIQSKPDGIRSAPLAVNRQRTIQRQLRWVEGGKQRIVNLADTLLALLDFGVTPAKLNNQEFPGGNASQALIGPAFLIQQVDEGVRLSVYAEPINSVGYRMELPADPPWSKSSGKDHVLSAINLKSDSTLGQQVTAKNVTLRVRGLPSDQKFADLVEEHEEHHVEELRDIVNRILVPWDAKIAKFKDDGDSIVAENAQKAIEQFYERVGGTPAEIGRAFEDASRVAGDAFHQTEAGGAPELVPQLTRVTSDTVTVYYKHKMYQTSGGSNSNTVNSSNEKNCVLM